MSLGLLGKKVGMTQIFNEAGDRVSVTVLEVGPCVIVDKKTNEKKYYAFQLGFQDVKLDRVNKPDTGHFKRSNIAPKKHLKEFRVSKDELGKYNVGDELKVNLFEKGSYVDITSRSKGRGFTGVIKRFHFGRPTMTHGTHEAFRHGGSIGGATPARVVKGRKMPGHLGNEQITVQNLEVVDVIEDKNLLLVKGAVPGHKNILLNVKPALKKSAKK